MEVSEIQPDTKRPRSRATITKAGYVKQNGKDSTQTPESTRQILVTTSAVLFQGTKSTRAPKTILMITRISQAYNNQKKVKFR